MMRAFQRSLLAGLGLAVMLSACSAGSLTDKMPEALGGLPSGAPARPVAPYQYPAVHDIPPPREAPTMTEEEQYRLERELGAVRDRQEAQEKTDKKPAKAAAPVTGKKVAPAAKKLADDPIYVPPASAKTSGAKTNP